MLTFYGVLPRIYSCFGTNVNIGLVVDVMTSPSQRGKGLFVDSGEKSLAQLQLSDVAGVIGFPIREEVMPGHLRVGWGVQFDMPIYILPVGRAKAQSLRKLTFNIFARIIEFTTRILRITKDQVREASVAESLSSDFLTDFYTSQMSEMQVSLEKSTEFLKWRLNRPGIEYRVLFCPSETPHAVAIVRQINLNGFATLAVLDFESDGEQWSKSLVKNLVTYAIDHQLEVIAFSTNRTNAKRLGILRLGFFRSHKKFKVITRIINLRSVQFTKASEKSFRMTWIDSDTV